VIRDAGSPDVILPDEASAARRETGPGGVRWPTVSRTIAPRFPGVLNAGPVPSRITAARRPG